MPSEVFTDPWGRTLKVAKGLGDTGNFYFHLTNLDGRTSVSSAGVRSHFIDALCDALVRCLTCDSEEIVHVSTGRGLWATVVQDRLTFSQESRSLDKPTLYWTTLNAGTQFQLLQFITEG